MAERKKRTTNKEAYEQGYAKGREDFEKRVEEIIDSVLKDYDRTMEQFPRNTHFVEIEVDAVLDLKEKIKYFKDDKVFHAYE